MGRLVVPVLGSHTDARRTRRSFPVLVMFIRFLASVGKAKGRIERWWMLEEVALCREAKLRLAAKLGPNGCSNVGAMPSEAARSKHNPRNGKARVRLLAFRCRFD